MGGYEWHDLAGILGVAIILVTYLLLQMEKFDGATISYCLLNALGSALVLLSLLYEFNLSAFVLEVAWLAISLFGLGKQLLRPRQI